MTAPESPVQPWETYPEPSPASPGVEAGPGLQNMMCDKTNVTYFPSFPFMWPCLSVCPLVSPSPRTHLLILCSHSLSVL